MVETSSAANSLKEYLKRYTSKDDNETKKKKKKKRKTKSDVPGVFVVDEDPIWQKPVDLGVDDEDSPDEDRPQMDEDIEVKRMRRLELLRSKRPHGTISEDGSGWVSISTVPNSNRSGPERGGGLRNDSPSPETGPRSDDPSGADLSPPRRSRRRSPRSEMEMAASGSRGDRVVRYDTPSPTAPLDSDGAKDLSPVRRKKGDSNATNSLPERTAPSPKAEDSDISPPRRARHGSNPPTSTSELSPPRKRKGPKQPLPPQRTGLVSAGDIKNEISAMKRESFARLQALDPSERGQNAAGVYRDKMTGRRISREEFLNSQKKEPKKEDRPKEIKIEWGKGLVQKQEAEARLKEIESEKNKPFARSRDDPDLDTMLKERVRWGDPMAHLVKKKHSEMILPDLGGDENMKKSGFMIPQEIPTHSWIRRGLPAAPNRHGIKPGRHWDGVDRSNGYEKEFFSRMNERRATEQEAYLWSVSDM